MAKKKATPKQDDGRMDADLAYAGGELDPVDDEDFDGLDRGDDPDFVAPDPEDDKSSDESDKDEKDEEVAEDDDKDVEPEVDKEGDDVEPEVDKDDKDGEEEVEDREQRTDDDEEEEPEKKKQGIPKKRFDKVNERMKKAEDRLKQLEREQLAADDVVEDAYDFDAKETEYQELLLDGKTGDASKLRGEIRAAERESIRKEMSETGTNSAQMLSDSQVINARAIEVEKQFPALDSKSDDFEPELLDDISMYTEGYITKGLSRPDAFNKAIKTVAKLNDLEDATTEASDTEEADKPKKQKRKVKEKLEADGKQPANIADTGEAGGDNGLGNVDINKISDADYDKLPEDTKRRMRGDIM